MNEMTKLETEDGGGSPQFDNLCLLRPCLNKYEDKGSFSTGRR